VGRGRSDSFLLPVFVAVLAIAFVLIFGGLMLASGPMMVGGGWAAT
jgi:hypothetical protein